MCAGGVWSSRGRSSRRGGDVLIRCYKHTFTFTDVRHVILSPTSLSQNHRLAGINLRDMRAHVHRDEALIVSKWCSRERFQGRFTYNGDVGYIWRRFLTMNSSPCVRIGTIHNNLQLRSKSKGRCSPTDWFSGTSWKIYTCSSSDTRTTGCTLQACSILGASSNAPSGICHASLWIDHLTTILIQF